MIESVGWIKIAVLFSILVQVIQSVAVEKWYKLDDAQTIFIEPEYRFNWFQARNECLLKNMTIIGVETSGKSTALTVLLKRIFAKPHNLWLGGDDLAEQGVFVWSSTGKRFEFTNWSPTNPSHNHGLEHCVNLWDAGDFEWNDAPCNELKGFICEENHFAFGARREVDSIKNALQNYYADCEG